MKIEHASMYVKDLEGARLGFIHVAFSTGRKEKVDQLTQRLREDGYYESCILDLEGNQIEITV